MTDLSPLQLVALIEREGRFSRAGLVADRVLAKRIEAKRARR